MRGWVAGLACLLACGSEGTDKTIERRQDTLAFTDGCVTAMDGICDELSTCPLGTDSTDCDAACAVDEWPAGLWGACAHDAAERQPPERTGPGTEGVGGPTGTWDGVVTVRGAHELDEVDRHFRVYVPRRYDPRRPTPVLFALGGFTVDMYWMAEFTELDRAADREDFIVVYGHPEYRNFSGTWLYAWYVYNAAWLGDWPDNPDIAYLEAVLDEVGDQYNVDTSRVYVSGHSRGAALSVIASFERPDLFAGFCSQAGFVSVNEYDERMAEIGTEVSTAAYLIHGDADPDVDVSETDLIEEVMTSLGWDDDLVYERLVGATHEWQSQLNPQMWGFLSARPSGDEP